MQVCPYDRNIIKRLVRIHPDPIFFFFIVSVLENRKEKDNNNFPEHCLAFTPPCGGD